PAGNEDSTGVVGSISTEVTVLKEEVPEHVAVASAPTVQATPAIRKLAKDMNVDLNSLKGSGAEGRITEDDVKNAGGKVATSAPAADSAGAMKKVRKYDMWGYVDHVPYKGMRKAIGDAMVKSAMTTAPVTQTELADITDLVALRKKEKVEAEKEGIKLTYLAYIMKALQGALEVHPMLNATLDDANADIVVKKYYNFGFAVDTGDGLLVPVIKRVNQKKLFEIAKEIDDLAEKARSRKIDPMELKGGGFTITNIGSIGGLFATPVINHPEVAILGLGRLHEAPLVREGKIEARWALPLSLTYDHRVIDGAEAARFMNTFVDKLTPSQ
ncbi:MAG: dihydrolipoamide acetyltransferase family protein, partial [Patescibacteria group bacterium]